MSDWTEHEQANLKRWAETTPEQLAERVLAIAQDAFVSPQVLQSIEEQIEKAIAEAMKGEEQDWDAVKNRIVADIIGPLKKLQDRVTRLESVLFRRFQ